MSMMEDAQRLADGVMQQDADRQAAIAAKLDKLHKELVGLEATRIAIIKPFYRHYGDVVAEIVELEGLDKGFAEGGIGAKIVERKGQWVDFTPYEVKSTRVVEGPYDKNDYTIKDATAEGLQVFTPTLDYPRMIEAIKGLIERNYEQSTGEIARMFHGIAQQPTE